MRHHDDMRLDVGAVATAALVLTLGSCEPTEPTLQPIHVRLLADLSGPSQEVGRAYNAGRVAHLRAINDAGGLRGHPIRFDTEDTGGEPAGAVQAYLQWKSALGWKDVVTLFGADTAASLALRERAVEAHPLATWSAVR